MQLFNTPTKINFIGNRKIALLFSALLFIVSIYSLVSKGVNLGIDFTGGTRIEIAYPQDIQADTVRDYLNNQQFSDAVVQHFGSPRELLIRVPLSEQTSDAKVSDQVVSLLRQQVPNIELRSVEFVGPQFGKELLERGLLALLYALFGIMIYVAFRFEWKFSLGSVAALVHDIVITMGVISITGLEFSLPVLAALLAVIGYSLNDTIVVFDRIRENFRKLREVDTENTMNASINQTLPRTILTSVTTFLVLLALFFYGGEVLKGFAATLIIGVFIGTYSSVFIASPTVLALGAKAQDLLIETDDEEFDNEITHLP